MEKNDKFSKPVQDWLDSNGYDIDSMGLKELVEFRSIVQEQIDKDLLFDLSIKLLGNGAYGASSHPAFYFYNIALASDITAECRETTRFMEVQFENFFHNEWWERTDIHKQFGIKLDQSKKEWYKTRNFCIYGDTDSCHANTKMKILGQNGPEELTIEEWYNRNVVGKGIDKETAIGHEIVETDDQLLNWSKQNGLYYGNVRAIVRHKVTKPKWKLKTKSGKEIIVTGDHSMIVFRNGEKVKIKPSEILNGDQVLSCI